MTQVQALKSFTHRGHRVAVGDVFSVTPFRAKLYERLGRASRYIDPQLVAAALQAEADPSMQSIASFVVASIAQDEGCSVAEVIGSEPAKPARRRRSYRRRDLTADPE